MCLTTGISWDTYWALTSAEVSALSEASQRVARRRRQQQRKG